MSLLWFWVIKLKLSALGLPIAGSRVVIPSAYCCKNQSLFEWLEWRSHSPTEGIRVSHCPHESRETSAHSTAMRIPDCHSCPLLFIHSLSPLRTRRSKKEKRWAIQLYALQRMASVTQFRSTSFFLQIITSLLVEIRWGYCPWDGVPQTGCLGATSTNHFTLCQCVACSSPFPLTEWIKDLQHP